MEVGGGGGNKHHEKKLFSFSSSIDFVNSHLGLIWTLGIDIKAIDVRSLSYTKQSLVILHNIVNKLALHLIYGNT